VAQVVEHLFSKREALNSNPNTAKKKKKKEKPTKIRNQLELIFTIALLEYNSQKIPQFLILNVQFNNSKLTQYVIIIIKPILEYSHCPEKKLHAHVWLLPISTLGASNH
jgi:hypothetical protein